MHDAWGHRIILLSLPSIYLFRFCLVKLISSVHFLHYFSLGFASLELFFSASSIKFVELSVRSKDFVPPGEGRGIIPIEVVVMEVVEFGSWETNSRFDDNNDDDNADDDADNDNDDDDEWVNMLE